MASSDEQIIELVRQNPAIYDMNNPKYIDYKYKRKLWNKIGTKTKMDSGYCRSRWNNMRDNYRKSMRKAELKAAKGGSFKLYKYHEQLAFLSDYLKDFPPLPVSVIYKDGSSEEEDTRTSPARSPSPSSGSSHQPLRKRKASNDASLTEYIVQTNEADLTEQQSAVDAFLGAIAPTLKNMSQYYLNMAKSEIFAIVQKYEMKMLTAQNVCADPIKTVEPENFHVKVEVTRDNEVL